MSALHDAMLVAELHTERPREAWGDQAQIDVAIGEMGELVTALIDCRRGRVSVGAVAEEVADVLYVAVQLAAICGPDDVAAVLLRKIARTDAKAKACLDRRSR